MKPLDNAPPQPKPRGAVGVPLAPSRVEAPTAQKTFFIEGDTLTTCTPIPPQLTAMDRNALARELMKKGYQHVPPPSFQHHRIFDNN